MPTNLKGTPGSGQVTLTWTPPATGGTPISDYVVQYRLTAATTWTTFPDTVSAAASAVVTGLTNGRSYFFRVLARNAVADIAQWAMTSAAVTPRA